MLKYLPSKKEDKKLYDKCKNIADKIMNPRTDLSDREQMRKQKQELTKQREEEQEKNFKGLCNLRALAKSFDSKNFTGVGLRRGQRIEAAIEALENIKVFMEQEEFVKANFNFSSIKEWEKEQNQETIANFLVRLITNPEFNEVIEYNASQLLQHLDTIRKFPEAKGCQYLDQDYDTLRYLRNYVEHGNPLLDKEEYEPGKEQSLLPARQKKVPPIMITLIFKLLPNLKKIREEVDHNDIIKSSEEERIYTLNNDNMSSSNDDEKLKMIDNDKKILEYISLIEKRINFIKPMPTYSEYATSISEELIKIKQEYDVINQDLNEKGVFSKLSNSNNNKKSNEINPSIVKNSTEKVQQIKDGTSIVIQKSKQEQMEKNDKEQIRALCKAAKSNDIKALEQLTQQEINVNQPFEKGFTALHYACQAGSMDAIFYLEQQGGNMEQGIPTNLNKTPESLLSASNLEIYQKSQIKKKRATNLT